MLDHDLEQAVVGCDRSRLGGDERKLCPGQSAQHLIGPDRVEGGEPVVDEDGDVHAAREETA